MYYFIRLRHKNDVPQPFLKKCLIDDILILNILVLRYII